MSDSIPPPPSYEAAVYGEKDASVSGKRSSRRSDTEAAYPTQYIGKKGEETEYTADYASMDRRSSDRSCGSILWVLPPVQLAFCLVAFVLAWTLLPVGLGLAVVWVGLPILGVWVASMRWMLEIQRVRYANVFPDTAARYNSEPIPPMGPLMKSGIPRCFFKLLFDRHTVRAALYFMLLNLPITVFEFALFIPSLILTPCAFALLPIGLAEIHARLTFRMAS